MMHLHYLTANAAYVFTFGDQLCRLEDWPMFFSTRREALAAATERGLTVTRAGIVGAA